MLSVVGVVMLADFALPKSWVYAWTQDQTPIWAKEAFLWPGLIATVTFVHACIATQTAANTRAATERERQAVTAVYRVSAACGAGGALCGTLLAFIAAAQMPTGMKLTTLASDLTMVGTVVGLAAAVPFCIFHTWRAVTWLSSVNEWMHRLVMLLLAVFDTWAIEKVLRLLPSDSGFLGYIISFI